MLLTDKEIKGLSVETKSGQFLGRVVRFTLESDGQRIASYDVCSHTFKSLLHTPEHHIHREQVLEITNTKMIVEDAVVTELVRQIKKKGVVQNLTAQEPAKTKISVSSLDK